jgi:hypothetical protein
MLAITYMKIMKIKVAKWGTPKKYLKKILLQLKIYTVIVSDGSNCKESGKRSLLQKSQQRKPKRTSKNL